MRNPCIGSANHNVTLQLLDDRFAQNNVERKNYGSFDGHPESAPGLYGRPS